MVFWAPRVIVLWIPDVWFLRAFSLSSSPRLISVESSREGRNWYWFRFLVRPGSCNTALHQCLGNPSGLAGACSQASKSGSPRLWESWSSSFSCFIHVSWGKTVPRRCFDQWNQEEIDFVLGYCFGWKWLGGPAPIWRSHDLNSPSRHWMVRILETLFVWRVKLFARIMFWNSDHSIHFGCMQLSSINNYSQKAP